MKNYEEIKKLCQFILSEDEKVSTNKAASARVRGYINEIRKLSVEAKRELLNHDKSIPIDPVKSARAKENFKIKGNK